MIFEKFDALDDGETFVLVNDHDITPLFYEMKAARGDVFDWKKIENGPDVWKVEIRKKTCEERNGLEAVVEEDVFVLNVTLLEPRLKHPTIFRYFDALKGGETFRILEDHDPKPLYYQMKAIRGEIFCWKYIEQGPKRWVVQIRKTHSATDETIGQIVAADLRKAEVFKKLGIDFGCGGKKTLRQACEEKGLDIDLVEAALDSAKDSEMVPEHFDRWNLDFLTDYIYNKHHIYYYDEKPVIGDLLEKVYNRHASHFPELKKVYVLYKQLAAELEDHMLHEERVVFPYIKSLVEAKKTGKAELLPTQFTIETPVNLMEHDHDKAGEILQELRRVTNGYPAPEGACNSFQFLYKKLKALDEDLYHHIHLENNILFPKAVALERELRERFSLNN